MNEKITDLIIARIKLKQKLSESDERICRYTLEGLISFFLKTIVIILISIFIGHLVETLLLIFIYGIFRSLSFGLHATKDIYCWISSILIYIAIPIAISTLYINNFTYYLLFLCFSVPLIYYTPADTPKRPLIRENKRKRNQMIVSIICLLFLLFTLLIDIRILEQTILFAIVLQSIFVNPFTYKIFNIQYNNYLYYKKSTV